MGGKERGIGNALAATVAVTGYIWDSLSGRRARQEEAQIQRVTDQSQRLLVPVTTQLHALTFGSTLNFVDRALGLDVVQRQRQRQRQQQEQRKSHRLKRFIECNKTASLGQNVKDSDVTWGAVGNDQRTIDRYVQACGGAMESPTNLQHPVAAALLMSGNILKGNDTSTECTAESEPNLPPTFRTCIPRELPQCIHDALLECKRPSSPLWKAYETFIRHEFVPAVEKVATILDESGHLMEPVPSSKLGQLFGTTGTGYGHTWSHAPRMWFYSLWIAYARSWRALLAEWDRGQYSMVRPKMDFPVGLLVFNMESQQIVARKEKDLIDHSQMHGHG